MLHRRGATDRNCDTQGHGLLSWFYLPELQHKTVDHGNKPLLSSPPNPLPANITCSSSSKCVITSLITVNVWISFWSCCLNARVRNAALAGCVPRMIPGKALNGVTEREEVIKLFIVTGGAESAMLLRFQAQLEEPAVLRMKPHPGHASGRSP